MSPIPVGHLVATDDIVLWTAFVTGIIGTVKNSQSGELMKRAGEALFDYLDSLKP